MAFAAILRLDQGCQARGDARRTGQGDQAPQGRLPPSALPACGRNAQVALGSTRREVTGLLQDAPWTAKQAISGLQRDPSRASPSEEHALFPLRGLAKGDVGPDELRGVCPRRPALRRLPRSGERNESGRRTPWEGLKQAYDVIRNWRGVCGFSISSLPTSGPSLVTQALVRPARFFPPPFR